MTRLWAVALFGIETRYVGRLYLLRALIALFALSAMVMAIDIAVNFDTVTSVSQTQAQTLATPHSRIAFYLLLRFAYNLPAILPLSAAIGIVWAEWTLARGYERAMIINAGRSSLLSLAPAVLVGLALGVVQVMSLTVLRPLSVEAHAVHGFRTYYGPRLSGQDPAQHWIALPQTVLQARIDFRTDPPGLSQITAYQLSAHNRLHAVITAPTARFDGAVLALEDPVIRLPSSPDHDTVRTRIDLDPVWLRNMGLEPMFWTQRDLTAVARQREGVPRAEIYRAILQSRYAAAARVLAICVLMATLCLAVMRPRPGMIVAVKLALAGYVLQFLSQYLTTLGKHAHLSPGLAFWLLPCLVILLCVAHHMRQSYRVHRVTAHIAGRARADPQAGA